MSDTTPTQETPFQQAVRKIGGPSETARRLGLNHRQVVSSALKRNPNRCPDGWALKLSLESGVPKSKLRPDLYPPRGLSA